MKKVITYGTYDLLHQGHINLLKRAKEMGDYLIVGVTNDNFDRERGKLNVRNNVLERVESVKATGLADQIIIEDYVGQKIDDIQKYDVDIFAIGSDWEGKFDYLKEFCEVVYLPRTEGVSSTMLRAESDRHINIGISGCGRIASRFISESEYVDAAEVTALYDIETVQAQKLAAKKPDVACFGSYEEMVAAVDAVYIATPHLSHYGQAKYALQQGKHVLCEKPLAINAEEGRKMVEAARESGCLLMEAMVSTLNPNFRAAVARIPEIAPVRQYSSYFCQYSSKYEALKRGEVATAFKPGTAGALRDVGVYTLYPLVALFGRPKAVHGNLKRVVTPEGETDVHGTAMLEYEDMNATLTWSKTYDSFQSTEIAGENGNLILDEIHIARKQYSGLGIFIPVTIK